MGVIASGSTGSIDGDHDNGDDGDNTANIV